MNVSTYYASMAIKEIIDGEYIVKINRTNSKFWFRNNLLHRDDGPAIEWVEGSKEWYQHGKLHRIDGPAKEFRNEFKAWFHQGDWVRCNSQEEFERLMRLKAFW